MPYIPPQKPKINEYTTPKKFQGWPAYNWDIKFSRDGV